MVGNYLVKLNWIGFLTIINVQNTGIVSHQINIYFDLYKHEKYSSIVFSSSPYEIDVFLLILCYPHSSAPSWRRAGGRSFSLAARPGGGGVRAQCRQGPPPPMRMSCHLKMGHIPSGWRGIKWQLSRQGNSACTILSLLPPSTRCKVVY